MGVQLSVERAVRKARGKPYDEDTLKKLNDLFERHPESAHDRVWNIIRQRGEEAKRRVRDKNRRSADDVSPQVPATVDEYGAPSGHNSGSSSSNDNATVARRTWRNCVGGQPSLPLRVVKPETLQQLVAVVHDAHRLRLHLRAVGSGHSFSDITSTTDAILVDMVLLRRVAMVDNGDAGIAATSTSRAATAGSGSHSADQGGEAQPARSRSGGPLVRVEAGITVCDLNTELDNRGLALVNMGAYDGQTFAGALSTGTHGSGIAYGPLANCVRAIVLVAADGTVYQIEPATNNRSRSRSGNDGYGPFSDAATFEGHLGGVPVVLRQDDAWFRTALVAMGCVGVIYSYVIEVTQAFPVRELRTATRWDDVRKELLPALWAPVAPAVAAVDHFELVLNPYLSWSHNACIRVERQRLGSGAGRGTANGRASAAEGAAAIILPSGVRLDWLSALLEELSIDSLPRLVGLFNHLPIISPIAINRALAMLVERGPYIDKSFRVFNLGPPNRIKAQAVELHCDARQCVPVIDKLLRVFRDEARQHDWYLAGPLGIRFVGASDAFLAPQAGRMTCAIELDMLVGVETGAQLARRIKERMCCMATSENDNDDDDDDDNGDLDLINGDDIRTWYPDFASWHAVYRQLNATGMFNNKFTDRVGISVPTERDMVAGVHVEDVHVEDEDAVRSPADSARTY
ncbi:FAD-dependent oxidoreductase [Niveomyces insectorum RCEF 264]|uniref:FAD-dependent oxidoreductase n=1 Tax=Niveomyces insectorum RCEF 264 TaxID=1081102 RepID=A0A167RDA7_9HYPO|nr:FAD-dependent oxidoreductase [Niveomyces insectorum RCEF 264]